jgi:hypothetical protein
MCGLSSFYGGAGQGTGIRQQVPARHRWAASHASIRSSGLRGRQAGSRLHSWPALPPGVVGEQSLLLGLMGARFGRLSSPPHRRLLPDGSGKAFLGLGGIGDALSFHRVTAGRAPLVQAPTLRRHMFAVA